MDQTKKLPLINFAIVGKVWAKETFLGNITDGLGGLFDIDPGQGSQVPTVFNRGISYIIGFLTVLGALFFLFQIFVGALAWISAGGNEGNLTNARNRIINALLGLVIIVAAYAIIALVAEGLLGLHIFTPLDMFSSSSGCLDAGAACDVGVTNCCNGSCLSVAPGVWECN